MDRARILVVASNEVVCSLKKYFAAAFFNTVNISFSGGDALRKANVLFPDMIITDYNLSDMTGLKLAKLIEESHICPVVILADKRQSEYIGDLENDSLEIFCITKPVNAVVFNNTVSLVLKFSKKVQEYRCQIDKFKNKIEERKLIERAKGILMEKFNMTESQAYRKIQKKAMNQSKSLVQIAKTLIDMFVI